MKDVLATRKLKWDTRMRLVRCYILSTLLYASETWVLNAETEARIRSLEMWIYRRMLKISYQQHISNESILVGLNVKPQLMKMVKERKCRYFGHIVRGERYEYQRLLLEGTVDGKRGRGRPRNTWFSKTSETGWELTMLLWFERHKIAISGGPWSPKSLMDMEPVIGTKCIYAGFIFQILSCILFS